jgi:hypothetical protein
LPREAIEQPLQQEDTMIRWRRYKPSGPVWLHLALGAAMWTAVGSMLALIGLGWIRGSASAPWLIAIGVVLGVAKAVLLLGRAAGRIVGRIRERGDGRCVGGFLSWRSWIFVAAMIGLGQVLRATPIPRPALGVVYLAVGVGLAGASVRIWAAMARGPSPG